MLTPLQVYMAVFVKIDPVAEAAMDPSLYAVVDTGNAHELAWFRSIKVVCSFANRS